MRMQAYSKFMFQLEFLVLFALQRVAKIFSHSTKTEKAMAK